MYPYTNQPSLKKNNRRHTSPRGRTTLLACLLTLATAAAGTQVYAQATFVPTDRFQAYYNARQLFAEGNYGLSYPVFKDLAQHLKTHANGQREIAQDELHYYTIACELMQGNVAAEKNAQAFLAGHHSTVLKGQMGYYLGQYYFSKQDYANAAKAFEQAVTGNLPTDQSLDMKFAQGYSYFVARDFKQAKPLLNEVRLRSDSRHYAAANYYYGFLAYNDRQYKDALAAFEVAAATPAYQPVAPYYTASIQYALGNKDKGLSLAQQALSSGNQIYRNELHQLIGHALFEKGDYTGALPYLEKYVSASSKVKREDLYELAYCYYAQQQYAKAIEQFKPLSGGQDSLSQHAMYLLGDAYLKTNDKPNAKTAFQFCAANSSQPVIKENSTFMHGKLAYDLGLDNEATAVLKQFVSAYPKSSFTPEARDLLVAALSNTSNYREALSLYESLTTRSAATQKLYPRILFNLAQTELNDKRPEAAESLIDRALAAPQNTEVLPLLHFWKGELLFAKSDYAGALRAMSSYLQRPMSSGEATPANAAYTQAYAYLMTADYANAQKELEKLSRQALATSQQGDDVKIRLADAYFMQKQFSKASPLYTAALDARNQYADYALYQLALIAGAEDKSASKISLLQQLDKQYPQSVLAPAAYLELAKTYLSDEKYKDALPWLAKIISSPAAESMKPEALLKQGLAHYNSGNNTEALNSFRTLLSRYGSSPEANEAVDNVRSIFIEQGKPGEFITFMSQAGRKLDGNTADSLTFVAAEIQLSENKKDQALAGFADYLKRFPEGRYVLPATWLSAELLREKKELPKAIPLYEKVVGMAPNRHVEGALLQLSRYTYFEQKDYTKAAGYYKQLKERASTQENKLEAMRGLVRCQYYSGDVADATGNARELLNERGAGTDDKVFAALVLGKQAQNAGNCPEAIVFYKNAADLSKAEYGAEARYAIAQCLYTQQKWDDAENAAFDLIKKSGSYALWVTRAYLLLGDIYHKQKDYFNAKATYKSVAENASIPALKQEAATKLAQVEKEEKQQSKID